MSWGEIMVIGGVALIVIGPKDLPKALRTVGQMTTKVRRMASEFQMQFNEAMREAELEDVRKEVDGLNREVSSATSSAFNPLQTIRDEIKGAVETRPAYGITSAPETPAVTPESPIVEEIGPAHHVEFASAGAIDGLNPDTAPLVPVPSPSPVPDGEPPPAPHHAPGSDAPLLSTGPGLEPDVEPAPRPLAPAPHAASSTKSVEA